MMLDDTYLVNELDSIKDRLDSGAKKMKKTHRDTIINRWIYVVGFVLGVCLELLR
jgi:hypothetical protein